MSFRNELDKDTRKVGKVVIKLRSMVKLKLKRGVCMETLFLESMIASHSPPVSSSSKDRFNLRSTIDLNFTPSTTIHVLDRYRNVYRVTGHYSSVLLV